MSIFSTIKSHAVLATTVTVLVVVVAVLAGRKATEKPVADVKPASTKVTVVSASAFRTDSVSVSANGSVESHSQADLKSQTSAPVATIHVGIGNSVAQGQIILELQNADIRAQLASAQASLALAQGTYGSTRQSGIDKVHEAYVAADNAIHGQVDPLILNTTGTAPQLYSFLTDSTLANDIRNERVNLSGIFTAWKPVVDAISATSSDPDIHAAIVMSQDALAKTSALLNDISRGVSGAATISTSANQTTISAWQTAVSAARASVNTAQSALTTAASNLANTGGNSTASAGVGVAQASVNNLQAQLDKTIIRSPISGKISNLPLREGELATAGTLLATVIGSDNSLQVKAFVSGGDLSRLKVGQAAAIQGAIKGRVSNVAPSVDPTTKKAEVDIDIIDSAHSGLIVGQNVTASISTFSGASTSTAPGIYVLPIQNVKIIPGSAYVLTVDQDSKIKFNPVTIGSIQGDFVQITAGMNDSMDIVTPVYELDEGETVTVQ